MRKGRLIFLITFVTLISLTNGQGSCLICDSSEDPNCATLKDASALIDTCEENNDNCFIQMDESGHVKRGCGTSTFCEGQEQCNVCVGQNCNNGMFPVGRLQCHKCSGVDCANPLMGPVETCQRYDIGDLCYTVVEEDDAAGELLTHRGCVSDDNLNMCDLHSDFCVKCSGDGCNNQAPSGATELSCIQCMEPDPACRYEYEEDNGQDCNYQILLGRPERCYTHVDSEGRVTRGCLDDFKTDVQIVSDCDGTKESCSICLTDNCNLDQVADPGTCVVCSSTIDPNCNILTGTPTTETCPTGPHDKRGCFRMDMNGEISRGCVSSLDAITLDICQAGQDCKICLEDNCNRQANFQTCYSCNSNEDQECIMSQVDEDPVICPRYVENCITYIDPESRRTIRGCQGDINLPPGVTCPSDLCDECSGESCNSQIFPVDRRSCNRCYSTTDCENDLSVDTTFQSVCEFYDPDDQCFSVLSQDVIHRGCLSDSSPGVQHCDEAEEKCIICSGQFCNFVAAYQESSLECVKCSAEDPACDWAFLTSSSVKCNGTIGLGEYESCYIFTDSDEKTVRGCTLEDPHICQISDVNCEICIGDGCNNMAMARQACIQCRSDREGEESCAQEAEGLNATICENSETTYETRGCYVLILDDGSVMRGCATDLSPGDLEDCKGESEEKVCQYCEDEGCNDQPAGSSSVSVSFLLLFLSLLGLVLVPDH